MPKKQQPVIDFVVHGPFKVPLNPGKKSLDERRFRKGFWEENEKIELLATAKGCYVFAIQTAHGAIIPWYVGMTARTFRGECPNLSNCLKIANDLVHRHGTIVMFLVVYQQGRGKPNLTAIHELETVLITSAYAKNPDLLNRKDVGTNKPLVRIRGVLNPRAGKPSQSAQKFKIMIGL
jgi:hypothetical protein